MTDTAITTTADQVDSPELWASLQRPLPEWFAKARLGIFIHWGPYSVPAWAEPTGALGAVPEDQWFATMPTPSGTTTPSVSREVQRRSTTSRFMGTHHTMTSSTPGPHRDFDPTDWAGLFSRAGAEYVIPTTKHHDGVALWEAPGTGARNTVYRGPRRDLVGGDRGRGEGEGLRFGVYYSGGLDWRSPTFRRTPAARRCAVCARSTPRTTPTPTYTSTDLVSRYAPDVLWNDIEWPDAGKRGADRTHCTPCSSSTTRPCPKVSSTTGGAIPIGTSRPASTRRIWRARPHKGGRTAAASASRSATTRSEDERQSTQRLPARAALDRCGLPRRQAAAQRRPYRRRAHS